jgi:hypothetical protein
LKVSIELINDLSDALERLTLLCKCLPFIDDSELSREDIVNFAYTMGDYVAQLQSQLDAYLHGS